MEIWIVTENLGFCSVSKSKNTLLTMVNGQVFCVIIWQPSSRGISNPPPGDTLSNSLRLLLGNPHQHPVVRMQNKLKQTNWFAKLKNNVLFLMVLNVLRIQFVQATI